MDFTSSPTLPFTSDPALLEFEDETIPFVPLESSNSDELEALHSILREEALLKNKQGIVIQHRAWPLSEVFRSDEDDLEATPLLSRSRLYKPLDRTSSPSPEMPSVSSPITYPPNSSPPIAKRPLPKNDNQTHKPKVVSGFMLDDSDDDDFKSNEPAPKRRMLGLSRDSSFEADKDMAREPESFILQDAQLETQNSYGDGPASNQDYGTLNLEPPPLEEYTPLPSIRRPLFPKGTEIRTCSGETVSIQRKAKSKPIPYEQIVAARSTTKAGRAKKSYYGIDIQNLINQATTEIDGDRTTKAQMKAKILEKAIPSVEGGGVSRPPPTLMWTEKYRARNFLELVGDDRTHRQVLRWLKGWDSIVFPGSTKAKISKKQGVDEEEKPLRKILLLTGPPGLGKTTLAHVCARQAGYEVMEINASDERSSNVVNGRIRTSVGTESVKSGSTVTTKKGVKQAIVRPHCIVIDEVDGVVGGSSGSGEGGFIKALMNLVLLDQRNTSGVANKKKKKGDDDFFKLMRPLILICNDVYHPALRPLRQSSFAEIIHVRKPPLDAVVTRMKSVLQIEGVSSDSDAVRRLCEATWGVTAVESRKGNQGSGEGDIRSVMVVGEWAARKLKASSVDSPPKLTRKWVDQNMTGDSSHEGSARGSGRGGTREVINRIFLDGAGFPKSTTSNLPRQASSNELPKTTLGVAEQAKKATIDRLREMVETSGEIDRIMTGVFSEYPRQPFNDDSILSKPNDAYEWLHFHDTLSSKIFGDQNWELSPYLSQPILACHQLFSSPARHDFSDGPENRRWGGEEEPEPLPFSGPRADYECHEATKVNQASILALQASLNPVLLRCFRSPEDITLDLLPYLVRMLSPEIKPIIVGGSGDQKGIASVKKQGEKEMVKRAAHVMSEIGIIFERGKLEGGFGSRAATWVYRMEPPLDTLVMFETALAASGSAPAPVRYAVRQVLDQEYQKNIILRESMAREARYKAANPGEPTDTRPASRRGKSHHTPDGISAPAVKRDFFGRAIRDTPLQEIDGNGGEGRSDQGTKIQEGEEAAQVWVTFHEGFSNAVRKPITVEEFLRGL